MVSQNYPAVFQNLQFLLKCLLTAVSLTNLKIAGL